MTTWVPVHWTSTNTLSNQRGNALLKINRVKYLASISTTLRCRDVLDSLTKALALNTLNKNSGGNIFLPQHQWTNCTDRFFNQSSLSQHSCGFGELDRGSKKCSSFSIPSLVQQEGQHHKQAVDSCSDFASSFNDTCSQCTGSILDAIHNQMEDLETDDEEQSICAVAIIVYVVSTKINDSIWVEDFYSCLLSLQKFASLVKAVSAIVIAFLLMLILILVKYMTEWQKGPQRPLPHPEELCMWSGPIDSPRLRLRMP